MKKTLIALGLLLAAVGAYFVFFSGPGEPDDIFHVEDITQVNKVEMSKIVKGKVVEEVSLERQTGGDWLVNGKYPARITKIENFLNLLKEIRKQQNIPEKGQSTALTIIRRNHTLVKIYDKDGNILQEYMIGATNNQQTANIMLKPGAEKAYLVAKPGVDGYVSIYYNTVQDDWRERLLFDVAAEDLAEVSVSYADHEGSYALRRSSYVDSWMLNEGIPAVVDRAAAYEQLFTGKVYAESFANAAYPGMMDSLQRRQPDVTFSYGTFDGKSGEIYLFVRPENKNNYFGYVKGDPELYTVQTFVFNKYLKTIDFFQSAPI